MRRQWHSSFPLLSSLCCLVQHLFQSTPQLRTVVIPINIKSLTSAPAGETKLHSAAQQQPHMGPALLVMARCLDVSAAPPTCRVFSFNEDYAPSKIEETHPQDGSVSNGVCSYRRQQLSVAGSCGDPLHSPSPPSPPGKDWERWCFGSCVLPLPVQAQDTVSSNITFLWSPLCYGKTVSPIMSKCRQDSFPLLSPSCSCYTKTKCI